MTLKKHTGKPRKTYITIAVEPRVLVLIDEIVEALNISRSKCIRMLIRDGVNKLYKKSVDKDTVVI